jgi:hypothetical protein
MVVLRLYQLRLRRGALGSRRLQGTLLILGIKTRHQLPGLDAVTDVHRTLYQAAADPEREVDFGLGLNRSGEGHASTAGTVLDGNHANRPDLCCLVFLPALTGRQQYYSGTGNDRARSGQISNAPRGEFE